MKYTVEFKLECVDKHNKGNYINHPDGIHRKEFMRYVMGWVKKSMQN